MPSPPAKGFSKEGKLGSKILDSAKYIGKNFWKVLPVGHTINLARKEKNGETISDKQQGISILYTFLPFYITALIGIGVLKSTREEKIQIKQNYIQKVDSTYNTLFQNAENFQDSLEIYKKYGLPIKLLPPSFEQKERIVKSLDSSLVK